MVALGDVIAHHVRPPNASSCCSSAAASSAGGGDEVRVGFCSLSCLFSCLHVLISIGEEDRLSVHYHHRQLTWYPNYASCCFCPFQNPCVFFHVRQQTRAADQSVCLDHQAWQHTLILSRKSLHISPCDRQVPRQVFFLVTQRIGMWHNQIWCVFFIINPIKTRTFFHNGFVCFFQVKCCFPFFLLRCDDSVKFLCFLKTLTVHDVSTSVYKMALCVSLPCAQKKTHLNVMCLRFSFWWKTKQKQKPNV